MLAKIQTKYRKIFKKLDKYYKICFKKCLKPKLKPKPYPNRRCSDIDCLPIYYLLIIAVPDSSLLYIQLNKC